MEYAIVIYIMIGFAVYPYMCGPLIMSILEKDGSAYGPMLFTWLIWPLLLAANLIVVYRQAAERRRRERMTLEELAALDDEKRAEMYRFWDELNHAHMQALMFNAQAQRNAEQTNKQSIANAAALDDRSRHFG